MNRFGWTVLAVFFAVAGLVLWSSDGGSPLQAQSPAVGFEPARGGNALVIPVEGVSPKQLTDTWEQSRDGGARVHQAIDIPAPMGTPVFAAMSGRVEKLFLSKLGGMTIYIRSIDGNWLTYYAHLSGYAAGLHEGAQVPAGQVIAFVGDTGNAGPGNAHLHFAVHRMASGEHWYQGTPVNPYPLLAGKRGAR